MGLYIQTPSPKNRTEYLEEHFAALEVPYEMAENLLILPEPHDFAIVCVVKNPNFEAAAWIRNKNEFDRFGPATPEDPRPRSWLLICDRALVERYAGEQAIYSNPLVAQ